MAIITAMTAEVEEACPAAAPLIGGCPDSRTDRTPTDGVQWRSWRFTIEFRQRIRELFEGYTYMAAYEVSKKGEKHFHVLTVGEDKHGTISKKIQRSEFWKQKKWWSKANYKTFIGALSYTTKCGDFWKSEDFPDYEYPKWIWHDVSQPTIVDRPTKRARADERDWQLTYSNLVFQAVKHHRAKGMKTDETLKSVVKDMIATTQWRPCNQMYKCGIVEAYELDFRFRIGQLKQPDMAWWCPKGL